MWSSQEKKVHPFLFHAFPSPRPSLSSFKQKNPRTTHFPLAALHSANISVPV